MAGKDLWLSIVKPSGSSMKEQLARKTLRNVRLQGHTYVDLRKDGRRHIFFCTLCLSPCYNETTLFGHLRGNLHKERYACAKATLIGPNPWPFNDGILFFHDTSEQNGDGIGLIDSRRDGNSRAMIVHPEAAGNKPAGTFEDHSPGECVSGNDFTGYDDDGYDMVIPGVMSKDEICELQVKLMGYGQISARFLEKDGATVGIKRIWCEWLGKKDDDDDDDFKTMSAASDFGIVTFSYYYDLGKQGLFEDIKSLLMSNEESDSAMSPVKRPRKSLSDPEDVSESLSNQCDSAGEDSQSSNTRNSRLLLDQYDDQLFNSRTISSKTLRRELRRQQRLAAERMCDICQQKMLPGKDVAALLNMKTKRLACSSRNVHGAFHVFHTSCIIHWILFCESEMLTNKPEETDSRQGSKRRTRAKCNELGKQCGDKKVCAKHKAARKQNIEKPLHQNIRSVFCSDCQGTGVDVNDDQLEKPTYHLSEMFRYKIKLSDGHRSWMKHPEELQNCSTGLGFELEDETAEEKNSLMKLLQFYRADEHSWVASS